MKTGRNEPCPCGSGRKYKHCCLAKDEAAVHDEIERAGRRAELHTCGATAFREAIDRVRAHNPRKIRKDPQRGS